MIAACGAPPRFQDMRTPSGEFCSDMPVFPAGQMPDKEYHRLSPIKSEQRPMTEAERLESLRKAACIAGGDAVIEAAQEEIRFPDATYGMIASGTAIIWTRRPGGETVPIKVHGADKKEEAAQEAPPAEPQAPPAEAAAPPPAPTAPTKAGGTTAATPAPTTTASAGPATAPTSTSTTKTKPTTKTKTK